MLLFIYCSKVYKTILIFFLNKIKFYFFFFKISSKPFHNLTSNSIFFCPAFLNTRGRKKLDELGFLVLRECIFYNLLNLF